MNIKEAIDNIKDIDLKYQGADKKTIQTIKYYVLGENIDRPSYTDDYYVVMSNVGQILDYTKHFVAKRYLDRYTIDLFISEIMMDKEVELALCVLTPNWYRRVSGYTYMRHTGETKEMYKRVINSGYPIYEDIPNDLNMSDEKERLKFLKILHKMIDEMYDYLPQRYYLHQPKSKNTMNFEHLIMNDDSIQFDSRPSALLPFAQKQEMKRLSLHPSKIYNVIKRIKNELGPLDQFIKGTYQVSCMVAGGFVFGCLFDEYEMLNKNGDIDIFLVGKEEVKMDLMKKIYTLLTDKKYEAFVFNNVMSFKKEDRKTIQLVNTSYDDPSMIIYSFDLSCVQVMYDGENIYGTPAFYFYTPFCQAYCSQYKQLAYCLLKTLDKGFIPVTDAPKQVVGAKETLSVNFLDDQTFMTTSTAGNITYQNVTNPTISSKKIYHFPESVLALNSLTIASSYPDATYSFKEFYEMKNKPENVNICVNLDVFYFEDGSLWTKYMVNKRNSLITSEEFLDLSYINFDLFYEIFYLTPDDIKKGKKGEAISAFAKAKDEMKKSEESMRKFLYKEGIRTKNYALLDLIVKGSKLDLVVNGKRIMNGKSGMNKYYSPSVKLVIRNNEIRYVQIVCCDSMLYF